MKLKNLVSETILNLLSFLAGAVFTNCAKDRTGNSMLLLKWEGIRRFGFSLSFLFLISLNSLAQTNYYSKAAGNLNTLATWGVNADGSGSAPANFTAANQIFNIRNTAAPTINGNWTVSGAGSRVIIGDGTNPCVFTVGAARVFSASTTISNNGTLKISSTAATPYSGILNVLGGGTYEHAKNGGSIPVATWASSSTCIVTGIGNASLGNISSDPVFGNFVWNCPGQTNNVILSLTNGIVITVKGNFDVLNTNNRNLVFTDASNGVLQVNGNLTVGSGGNTPTFILNSGGNNTTINIGGNLSVLTSATLRNTSGNSAVVNLGFTGALASSIVTWGGGGSFTNTDINYVIQNVPLGKTVTLSGFNANSITLPGTSSLTIRSGATLNCVSQVIAGAGSFTLQAGGILGIGHINGINGNISTTGGQTFNANSAGTTFIYNGTVAQVTGSNLPTTVYNLTINNPAGVTLSKDHIASNILTMTQGNITTTNSYTLSLSNPNVGALTRESGTVIGKIKRAVSTTLFTDYTFPVGNAAFYRPAVINFSALSAGTDITAEFISVSPPGFAAYTDGTLNLTNVFSEGYWSFKSSGLPAATYTLKLTGNGFTSNYINEVTRITGRFNGGTGWGALGVHGLQTGNTVTRTGITTLNTTSFDFGFATTCTTTSIGYKYERDISVDYTKVAGGIDLYNFPVLVTIAGQNYIKASPVGQIANSNGYDIIFTDDNYNKLDHQIEYYNSVTGDYIAWVRIPTLSSSANTNIKMLYGNPLITTDLSVTSVWDTHYKGVWHLDNSGLDDFTSYGRPGSGFNAPTYPNGNIYNSIGLSGGNQYAVINSAPNTNFTGNITVSAWVNMSAGGYDQKIAGNQDGIAGGYKFGIYTDNRVEFEIRNAANNPYLNRTVAGGTFLTTNQWYYLAGMSSDVLDSIKTFVNGIPERPFSKTGTLVPSSNNLTIGKEPWDASAFFHGNIDELRISDEVRSDGWLRTEYNNQSSPGTFYSISPIENPVSNLPSMSICNGPITLSYGFPTGGTYTASAGTVVGNLFTPPAEGTYTITYTYTVGCGTSVDVKDIIITGVPDSPIATDKEYCIGNIAYLEATSGTNIKWHLGATTTLVSTANPFSTGISTVGTYNYNVTQTVNGCESAPTPVTLTIFAGSAITGQPASLSKCIGDNASFSVTATGPNLTYQWKKGAINVVDGGTVSGANTPTLSLTNVQLTDAGNYTCVVSSSCGAPLTSNIAVLQVNAAPTPAINGNNLVCPFSTFNYFTAIVGGHAYSWTATGGTIIGSSTGSSINVDWGATGAGSVTVIETVSTGCFTTQNYLVNIVDGVAPTIVACPANITVNAAAGSCSAVVNWTEPSATDLCSLTGNLVWTKSHVPGATFPVGTTTVTYTVQDQTGNSSAPCSFTVTVTDNQLPTITAPAPVTVGNDAGICTASGVVLGVPVTTDNCSVASVINNAPAVFPLGPTTVTWTVTDGGGNIATATQLVTVNDTQAPNAICKSITINLDITGNATITAADINNGSTDNCGIASISVAPNAFTSANIGGNTVTLTVTDNSGNVSTCTSTVTLLDNNPPIALCKDVTVQLGAGGTVNITGATVDNGSSDPDGIASLVVAPNSFSCSDIGANAVVLTVTDGAGKVSTCNSIVTVVDNLLPTISCPGNVNVNNDPGICGAIVNYLTPVGLDNCSGAVTSQTAGLGSGSTFPVGTTTNTFLVTDGSGNVATCSFTVTVTDNEQPVIILPVPPVVNANAGCQAPIPAIAATISDNCTPLGSLVISQIPAAGTMAGLGVTNVSITATDLKGNIRSTNIDVTVVDVTKPVITAPADITTNLDNNCQALVPNFLTGLVVSDNCTVAGSIVKTQTPVAGTVITGVASTNILIEATDASGNMQSVTVLFITNDVVPPVVICKDINLYLDGTGNATLIPSAIDNGSVDNCSPVLSLSINKSAFNCSDLSAPVSVTLTGKDASLNSGTCNSIVTVLDTIKPTVNVQTFNLVLNPVSGTGTLLPANVNNGSFDNCGPITLSVSPNTFGCGDQGVKTVTLTVLDSHGNSRSKTVNITVSSTLNIDAMSLSSCDLAAPFALYTSIVTGGNGTNSYAWSILEGGINPFVTLDAIPPFIHFSNTSTSQTPFFNNLMPDGIYNIRLIVTDGNGCKDTSLMVLNKGGIIFNNITKLNSDACEGETKSYSVAASAGATYSWNVTDGTFLTPTNTNTVTVQWNMGAASGLLVANIVKPDMLGNPCGSSVENTVTTHSIPLPVFSVAPLSVCSGTEYTYTLTSTYSSHSWSVTGGAISGGGGATDNFVKVSWGVGPAGTVTVNVTNGSGCINSATEAVVINALPVATLISTDADNTFCAGTSVTFTAGGGNNYNFRVNGASVQNSAIATFTTPALTNGQVVDVIVTNASTCSATSAGITNTVIGFPTPTISSSDADNSFCAGTSVTFTASGGTIFDFRVNGISVQNSGAPTYTTTTLANSQIVDVIVTNAGGCSTTSAGIANTVIALPIPTLASSDADNKFCAGTSVTFTAGGGTNYNFRVDGVSVQNGVSTAYITTGLTNGQVVDVIVTNASTCTAISAGISNTVDALPVPTLTSSDADNLICAGSSVIFSAGGGTSYNFRVNGSSVQNSASTTYTTTTLTNGQIVDVIVTNAGGCTGTSAGISTTVTTLPTAVISYSGSPWCTSAGIQSVTLAGTGGGTYSAPAGLSINSGTGEITPAGSTAGTYTVTYTLAATGGCGPVTATTSVTITALPTATISYTGSPWCTSSGIQNVTFTGTSGGIYSAAPAGLSLNAGTGAIIPGTSIAGTYTVTYTIAAAGGCGVVTATTTVTITALPTATISYGGSPFCNSLITAQPVTLVGTAGGLYSATPAALTLNAGTGEITPNTSTSGAYIVTYTIASAGGCGIVTATAPVTVTTLPVATFSYTGISFCNNGSDPFPTYSGGGVPGVYSSTPGLVFVSTATGQVDLSASTPGSYTVTNTIAAAGGCGIVTATGNIIITTLPTATISYPGSPYCSDSGVQNVTLSGTSGGTFSAPAGLSINALSGAIDPGTSTAGTYTVSYDIAAAAGCGLVTATTSVTITTLPAATISYTGSPWCSSLGVQSVTLVGTPGGSFSAPAGLSINAVTGVITPGTSSSGTYTVTYTLTAAGGCSQITATTSVTVNTVPSAPTVSVSLQPTCAVPTGTIVVSAPLGAQYEYAIDLGTYQLSPTFTPVSVGNHTVTARLVASPTCVSPASSSVTINAQPATPAAPTVGTITQPTCALATGSVVLSGLPAGNWTINPGAIAGNIASTTISGLVAGTYNYTVTNAVGCTSVLSANIVINAQPATPTAPTVGTITQPTCALATGSVVLSGLPAGNWTINPGAIAGSTASTTISGLVAGTYNYTVTNAVGCTSVLTANIVINTQPATPTAPVVGVITQPTCAVATGSVILNSLPAIGTWTINPGAITGSGVTTTISGLVAGTYTYFVTNAAGCTSVLTANIVINAQPATPAAPTVGTITQPTCALATGSVVLSGLPAGNWTINPGAIAGSTASTTISGLVAGTYNYTVTNAVGCTSVLSANIVINAQPATPAAPTVGTITQPTCALATGSVVLSGLPAGNWTINPGAIAGNTASTTISGLVAGTYNYTVTNAVGCTSVLTANIVINTQPATPTAPVVGVITQPTCAVATGSVILNSLPAIGTWTINPGAITGSGVTTTISGLVAGTYTYFVTNAAGCTSVLTANIVINAQPATPAAPTVGTITQPTCALATGSVVLSGLPAGNWTINPGAIAGNTASTTISGLVAGTYNYTVTNAVGCTSVLTANIVINTQPATPTAPVVGVITQPTCAVATGSVILNSLPAIGTWTINPGAITGSGVTTTISGLVAGTYTYFVTNAAGCTSVLTANIVINAQPATPAAPTVGTITQPTCALATGSVVLSGLPAGNWTINPGAIAGNTASTTISGLVAGTYNYTVTNAVGCTSVLSANIVINAQPATPAAPTVGTITQPTCALATGSVVLSGLPAGNWTINPGAIAGNTASTTISGLVAGTYNYTVTNAVGCTSVLTANIVINAQPATPAAPTVGTITQPTCALATGSVVLSGLPAGNWTINPGAIAGSTASTTISGLVAGTYNYTVTNAVGCTSVLTANIVINTQPATPTAPVVGVITQPTCAVATGSVILNSLPAIGTWTINPGAITGSGVTTTISGLVAGTYTYFVTNAAGCTSVLTANIVINAQPATPAAPTVGTITQPTCALATGSVVLSGLPAGNWTINPGAIAGSTASTTISGLVAGTYNYTVTNAVGCTSVLSANIVINAQPATPAAPTVGTITQPTCALATGSVVLSGLPAGNWTINPGAIAGNTASTTISGLVAGTYNYTVTNAVGCTSVLSANIVINAQPATPTAPTVGTITQPTCALATGSVVLSGLPAGNWTINPGAIAGSTASTTISGLVAGTYNYTVTNAVGCTSVLSANIVINAQPATPAAPTVGTITQPTCALATGSVVLSGLPAGNWTINPGAIAGSTASTTISGLVAGTYNYTVTNAAGCISAATANIVFNTQTAPASATASTTIQPTCILSTGTIIVSSPIGAGYEYNIDGSAYQSSTVFAGVPSGAHNILVRRTTDNTCISIVTVVIVNTQPVTPIAPTVGVITQPTCALGTGSVILNGLPAIGTWTINPGAISGSGVTTTISGLVAGTYNYILTNEAGCTSVASSDIVINAQPATPTAPTVGTITQPTCALATGSVVLSGLPAGNWTINPGAIAGNTASTTISGLVAGTYNYAVTNAVGCTSVLSANIVINAQPATPTAPTVGTITQPTCALATGSVVLSGLPAGNWTINPGAIAGSTASTTISGLVAGTYNYTVTNAVGCTSVLSANIVINAQPATPAAPTVGTITQPTCALATGSVVLSGLPAGNWTINPGAIAGSTASTTISGLVAGTYNYTVTNAVGCTSVLSANLVINAQPATPTASTVGTITQPTCALATGSVVLSGLPAGNWTINPGAIAGSTASTTISGLVAGTYNYTVTNAAGCTSVASSDIVINIQPPAPAIPTVATVTQPTCGNPTGTIEFTSQAGVEYSVGSGYQAGTIFAGLTPGTYTLTVRSIADNSCITPAASTVTIDAAPAAPAIPTVATLTQSTCGTPTGTIEFTSQAGVEYSVGSGYQAGTVFAGLTPGTYTLTVRSIADNSCITPAASTVTIDAAPAAPAIPTVGTVTQPTCGTPTGTIEFTSQAGVEYSIGSGYQAGTIFAGLTPGTYTLTVRSIADNSCITPAASTVTIDAAPAAPAIPTVATVTQPTCGTPTGTIEFTSQAGVEYSVGSGYQAGTVFAGLTPGTYTLTVRSIADNSCITPAASTVTIDAAPAAPAIPTVATVTQPTCGTPTGTIEFTSQAGVEYSIGSGYQAGTIFAGLTPGTYTLTVRSIADNSCITPAASTVTIDAAPAAPAIPTVATVTQPTCGTPTGTIEFTSQAGVEYSVGSGYQAGTIFAGLTPGTYTLTVRSIADNSCITPTASTVTIDAVPVPLLTITNPSAVCSPSTVDLTAAAVTSGSTAGLTFTYWIDSAATLSFTTETVATAGTYYIKGTDPVSGCFDIQPVTVTVNPTPTVTVIQTNLLCNGSSTGAIDITATGGTGPYTFVWTGTGVVTGNEDQSGLSVGSYSVIVTDADNCSSVTLPVNLTEPSALSGSITTQTNVTTFGGTDGSVTVAGSGGTSPYLYSLNGGTYQASGTFGTLSAGVYTITVQDANLCHIDVLVTIIQPVAVLTGSIISQTNVACFSTAGGSVTVTGSGGATPYEYSLDAGAFQSSGTFGTLTAGTYTVTIRDAVLNTFDVIVTISQPSSAVGGFITSQTNVLCYGSSTGSISVDGSGGVSPYHFKIGAGAYQVSGTFGTLPAGDYIITVQDANLCTSEVPFTITQPALELTGSIIAQTNVSCSGSSNGSVAISGAGGTSPYEYSLNGGTYQVSGLFNGLAAANYIITVRDVNLCTTNVSATITEPEAVSISESKVDASCPDIPDGSIILTLSGGTQPYTVIWSDGILTKDRLDIPKGDYSVVVTDINGCAASLNISLGVVGSANCIQVNEIITPNNDGFNDTWKIKNIDLFPDAEVFVFTRWGKLVFNTKNISAHEWDGTYKGKLLPTDSYHYILYLNDGSEPRSGVISIIR